jgi:hypothetical protein
MRRDRTAGVVLVASANVAKQTYVCPLCNVEFAAEAIPRNRKASRPSFPCPNCGKPLWITQRFGGVTLFLSMLCPGAIAYLSGRSPLRIAVVAVAGILPFYMLAQFILRAAGIRPIVVPAQPIFVRDGDTKLDLSEKPKQ